MLYLQMPINTFLFYVYYDKRIISAGSALHLLHTNRFSFHYVYYAHIFYIEAPNNGLNR